MEQRIDPKIQTEFAAGTDPAYIPGLVAPAPPKPAGKEPGRAGDETEEPAAADEAAAPATAEKGEEQPEAEQRPDEHDGHDGHGKRDGRDGPEERDAPGGRDEDGERDPAAEKEPAEDGPEDGTEAGLEDGPVFEVSDRRGSITADREGVRFRLDDQEAEFDWDEIGAVEVKTPRFGRRFTVTVHISSRRWFDAEVEAPAKNLLKQWEAELDEVLDAYFEES
ncbi:hypothetical protein [Streptomyces sp. NPDC056987]|uniref:hypothetical protein n=1 Tax=Streptomyces sp. NPDC056987 TaxID=3345988 RepID=UPI00363F407D